MRIILSLAIILAMVGCNRTTEPEPENGFSISGILVSIKKPSSAQESDTTYSIYSLNPQNGTLNRLPVSTGDFNETNPILANGRLFFASDRDGDMDIYSANPETGEIAQIFDLPGNQKGPSVSPNGKFLAYHYEEMPGGATDIGIYDMQSNSVIKTLGTPNKMDMNPEFVNDSILLLILQDFQGNISQDIYMYNLNTDQISILENTPYNQNARPRVSPDGSRIAYLQSDLYLSYSYLLIADFPSMGNKDTLVADPDIFVHTIAWSPDGSRIAFSASIGSYRASISRVYVVDINTKSVSLIYEGSAGENILVNDWK